MTKYTYMELIDQVGSDYYRSEETNADVLRRWDPAHNAWIEAWPFEYLGDLTAYVVAMRGQGEDVTYVEVTEDDVR